MLPSVVYDRVNGDHSLTAKSDEERRRMLARREEALVQNKVLRAINRRGLSVPTAIDEIRQRAAETRDPVLQRITDFLDRSERPICTAFHSRSRSGYDARPTT